MEHETAGQTVSSMRLASCAIVFFFTVLFFTPPASAQQNANDNTFSQSEMVREGHEAFGKASADLASVIEHTFRKLGRPNAFIAGQEGGGSFVAGLTYGEGWLRLKNGGKHKVFWQGPSLGIDFGADGARVMVLVYNMKSPDEMFDYFPGVKGSAYIVGGVGATYRSNDVINLVIIRTGLGIRLGINAGYLKYTRKPTWNPF